MDKIQLAVLVNKVNAEKIKEIGTAHGGTLEVLRSAHALAETEEPAVQLAEKVIDHDILGFTFDSTKDTKAFADAAADALGVAPGIFKGTMTATRNGKKFDLPLNDRDQAEIKQG
jgi:hypothetical protein